jgi:Protein of unknown function (DUF4232)
VTMSSHRVPRRTLTALVLGGAALLATACGSSGSPTAAPTVTTTVTAPVPTSSASASTPAPTPSESTTPGSPPPCPTSALHVSTGQGNGAAGSQYVPIVFTNTSGDTCSLFGYPGVSFVTEGSGGGSQIGRAADRSPLVTSQLITLVPGAAAHATLQIADAANFPAAKCQPVMAHWLKIYPPNQTAPLYLHFSTQACASHAKAAGTLNVQSVQLGSASS